MTTGWSDVEREIRAVNDAFVRHFNARDAEQLVQAVYAEAARLLPANAPTIRGRAQILEAYREILASGMGGLVVDNCEVEVAGSGDLAYAIGTFSVATPELDRGKFVEIYRKQADGSWRCIADMFSSDRSAT
jgi:uncharacterized protein (TIGR02246 family)